MLHRNTFFERVSLYQLQLLWYNKKHQLLGSVNAKHHKMCQYEAMLLCFNSLYTTGNDSLKVTVLCYRKYTENICPTDWPVDKTVKEFIC